MPTRPHEPPVPITPVVAAVTHWAAQTHAASRWTWRMIVDSDGAVGLVPQGPGASALPAMLIMALAEGGFEVTACYPDDPWELGTFSSIEAALDAMASWLDAQGRTPFSGSA